MLRQYQLPVQPLAQLKIKYNEQYCSLRGTINPHYFYLSAQ